MLLFMDGGAHYSAAVSQGKWSSAHTDFNPASWAGSGRFDSNPIFYGFSNRYAQKVLPGNYGELIAGCAIRYAGDGNFGDNNIASITFWDLGTVQFHLRYSVSGGYFNIYRGSSTYVATIPYAFKTTRYEYFEFRVKFHSSTGQWELRRDGETLGSGTGLNTINTSNAYAGRISLGDAINGGPNAVYYDDLYVLETAGGGHNTFLGECKVACIYPNGNGVVSNFVGSDSNSTDNYLLVDEATPNDDTDYIESDVVTDKDMFNYQSSPMAFGNIYGVQILPYGKKTDLGSSKFKAVSRLSTTEEDGAENTMSTAYQYFTDIRETKPGGGDWTPTDIDNAQFGVKVTG